MPLPEDSEPATLAALASDDSLRASTRAMMSEHGLPPGLGVNLSADGSPMAGPGHMSASMDHTEPDQTR